MTDNIDEKIQQFIKEVGTRTLSFEQQKIYKAFTRTKGHPISFQITDKSGRIVKFAIDPSKNDDGPQHVLQKHYQGNVGRVTAIEILNMLDTIRYGDREPNSHPQNRIVYKLKKRLNNNIYTFCLKISNKKNIFKSFYSNR